MISRVTASGSGMCGVLLAFVSYFFINFAQVTEGVGVLLDHFTSFKDGGYYCYCAYVLRISRYSDFLSPMLTNTGTFLRGLKLSGESRS